MYNANKPVASELPSTVQLLRSTLLALVAAIVILATIVLPAEYALDPTGMGRVLGLTEMGEIKAQLAEEAAADRLMKESDLDNVSESGIQVDPVSTVLPAVTWRDEVTINLSPGQGAEIKLEMAEGSTAVYSWTSRGGPVNFDLHGDGGGRSISYEKGRGIPEGEGELMAEFSGNHGWFFRNRNKTDVTVVLKTKGEYAAVKRLM